MTTTFTASNRTKIEISQDGYLLGKGNYGSGPTDATAGPEGIDALREYFQHERDTELGRWRDPENPDHLVYRSYPYVQGYRRIAVVNERDMSSVHTFSEGAEKGSSDPKALTAQRYFAAHPEPKPWHSAQPGEVWLLDIKGDLGREAPAVVNGQPEFRTYLGECFNLDSHQIVHARKIWPEESDDER